MKVRYTTPTETKTQECDRFDVTRGEGVNGPFVLSFFKGKDANEKQIGGASRVTDFSEE